MIMIVLTTIQNYNCFVKPKPRLLQCASQQNEMNCAAAADQRMIVRAKLLRTKFIPR
jgi:hypothetical protein